MISILDEHKTNCTKIYIKKAHAKLIEIEEKNKPEQAKVDSISDQSPKRGRGRPPNSPKTSDEKPKTTKLSFSGNSNENISEQNSCKISFPSTAVTANPSTSKIQIKKFIPKIAIAIPKPSQNTSKIQITKVIPKSAISVPSQTTSKIQIKKPVSKIEILKCNKPEETKVASDLSPSTSKLTIINLSNL